MSVIQISRIMNRRGLRIDLPSALNDAEFGWAENTRQLFIGNGPFFGGNTEILTEETSATLPKYTYVSNTDTTAITGFDPFGDVTLPDANFPTVRNYQEKFDDFVSVKDYGAVGDGLVDDTGAVIRALRDLYDERSGSAEPRRPRALYFPAGTYRVSLSLPLYPLSRLFGDGKDRTFIFMDFSIGVTSNDLGLSNDCVARTVDSLGCSALNIGIGTPVSSPEKIHVMGIAFQSNTPQTEASGPRNTSSSVKEIIKLERIDNVRFEDCAFIGTWVSSDSVFNGSTGVLVSRLGDVETSENYSFVNCDFKNVAFGINSIDAASNIHVTQSLFEVNHRGIKLGLGATDVDSAVFPTGPNKLFRVSFSKFLDIDEIGFDVRSVLTTAVRGNISTYNSYEGSYIEAAVRFDETTESCVSIGDTFANLTPFDCSQKLVNKRVRNLTDPNVNVVMNAQDLFQIPTGFCGDILIDGDLHVTGDLILDGSIVNNVAPIFPLATTTIHSVPFDAGNVIFFEYGMRLGGPGPGGVYRIGTMQIVHNGEGIAGPGDPDAINFTDTYNELDGPPADPIELEAVLDLGNAVVDINFVTVGPTPFFNFTTRIMTV